jgi:hypothetical protein
MGKAYAPSLANLYLVEFDHAACNNYKIKPKFYFRYLDDIFFIWPGSRTELTDFFEFLNSVIPGIKLTFECSDKSINFLDTTVYKEKSNFTLQTKTFFKETDTHQLLHTLSHHPKHTTKGILKSQFIRFKRLSSTKEDYYNTCKILKQALIPRGYSKTLMLKIQREIFYNYDADKPKEKDNKKLLPLVVNYDNIGKNLIWEYKNALSKYQLEKRFKVLAAYKNHKNIRQTLVSKKIFNNSSLIDGIPNPDSSLHPPLSPNMTSGFSPCNSTRCFTCKQNTTSQNTFKSYTYGNTYKIHDNLSCNSKNIIYLISCKKCNLQYVGETERELRQRTTDHRSNIRTNKITPIGRHFNSTNHTSLDLHIIAIEKIREINNKRWGNIRKQREEFWQIKLGTKYPAGMNCMPLDQ